MVYTISLWSVLAQNDLYWVPDGLYWLLIGYTGFSMVYIGAYWSILGFSWSVPVSITYQFNPWKTSNNMVVFCGTVVDSTAWSGPQP